MQSYGNNNFHIVDIKKRVVIP